mgnify:CR=1 FL=1
MLRHYKNPPVIEAIVEFRFPQNSSWDMTIPGRLYERLKDHFPKKESHILQEIQIRPSPQSFQHQITNQERIILISEDNKQLIQVGPYLLSINRLAPYQGWQEFKPIVQKAMESLVHVIDFKHFQRIGLRYVNKIEIPKNGMPKLNLIKNHFNFGIFIGDQLPKDVVGFLSGCVFSFGQDLCKVELSESLQENSQSCIFILDLDYFNNQKHPIPKDNVMEWIDNAHNQVEMLFEGIITDKLRESFGE